MSKSITIRHPRSYQKACERKHHNHTRAAGIVERRIVNHIDNKLLKIMSAKSWDQLVWSLAEEVSITARLRLPHDNMLMRFTLVSNALKALVQQAQLLYYADGEDVVVGIPQCKRPRKIAAVESFDPEFDWASLHNTRCTHAVWRELIAAH